MEEDSEEKSTEIIVIPLQSKCIETLEKAVQTQNIDANVSNHELATYVYTCILNYLAMYLIE